MGSWDGSVAGSRGCCVALVLEKGQIISVWHSKNGTALTLGERSPGSVLARIGRGYMLFSHARGFCVL